MALPAAQINFDTFYRDLQDLYPNKRFSPLPQEQRIQKVLSRNFEYLSPEIQTAAEKCYQLVYQHAAPSLYYAANQILDRLERLHAENPDQPVCAVFSGRDATGLWCITRAVLELRLQRGAFPIPRDRLALVYLSRPVVYHQKRVLRAYIEQEIHVSVEKAKLIFVDVGWCGTRLKVLREVARDSIASCMLLFSRVTARRIRADDLGSIEIIGIIDDLQNPLPELRPPEGAMQRLNQLVSSAPAPHFQDPEPEILGIAGSREVVFIEDLFAGPFSEVQQLERGASRKWTPFSVLRNLWHDRITEDLPRFVALLALIDRVVEIARQREWNTCPTQAEARQHMSTVLRDHDGIFLR